MKIMLQNSPSPLMSFLGEENTLKTYTVSYVKVHRVSKIHSEHALLCCDMDRIELLSCCLIFSLDSTQTESRPSLCSHLQNN